MTCWSYDTMDFLIWTFDKGFWTSTSLNDFETLTFLYDFETWTFLKDSWIHKGFVTSAS